MSDSILYLAIVAIWAGFLIPAWVRRPHTSRSELDEAAENSAATVVPDFDADVRIDTGGTNSEYRDAVDGHGYPQGGSRPVAEPARARPASAPSQSREQMMRARRRILTILASLVVITTAFVVTGFVRWWICVPPVVLLVLYVLLLREIAMAEAELTRKRASLEARAARDVWRRAHQAWAAERAAAAEPTADVIDISSRVGDQLYDQYADAAVRAVGD